MTPAHAGLFLRVCPFSGKKGEKDAKKPENGLFSLKNVL